MSTQKIAVLGAGPIGIETAVHALERGYAVDIYEKDTPGAHVSDWGHVRLFSPWKMNRSAWGERMLREAGYELADAEVYPTAREYLDSYLLPLARLALVDLAPGGEDERGDRLHEACLYPASEVVGVSRRKALKGDYLGDSRRADASFVILCNEPDGERYAEADIVIDTTGVYAQSGHLGPGGLPALGEQAADSLIDRRIPDVLGADKSTYADKTTLLVGNGFSAVTSAHLLAELHKEAPGTHVHWLLLDDEPPYTTFDDDPLPARLALTQFGNQAARGQIDGIEPVFGQLGRLERGGAVSGDDRLSATIDLVGGSHTIEIDRVIGNVGYKPDTSLYRELQVHQCYASEGPMKLAAYLLGQKGGGGDCLAQTSGGFETLVSPEPDFYILGSKSYGRNSDFLLTLGFEQIEELFNGLK